MERFFTQPEQVADLRGGPLERYLQIYAASLEDDGYSVSTGRFQLQVFGDFSRWLQDHGIGAEEITRNHSISYIQSRDKRRLGKRADAEAALNRLAEFLQKLEVVPLPPSKPLTALEGLTKEFGTYLLEQRGLSEKTVAGYERMALYFLRAVTEGQSFDPLALTAQKIFKFAEQQGMAQKSKGKDTLNAVRAFLRFAYNRGYVTNDLAQVVPRLASWSLASIPKSVSTGQVEKVLLTCDRTTAYGKRDYAILLLLARLGLRVGEVASLSLDDINWETGTLTVSGKSGPRTLPIPKDVGQALAQYLSEVRPTTKSRIVFFRLRPPIRPITSQESLCGVVRRAMQRARIKTSGKGAHQFRHGLATELLRKGASIPEIGEILGHRKMKSTMIYAKVDLTSLRKLAKRWPGGAL